MKNRLLIHSAKQIVQVVVRGEEVLAGDAMKHLMILNATDKSGLSLVVDGTGCISFVGHDYELKDHLEDFEEMIDATNCALLPGFVDAHTHPVWSGDRIHEFAMKMSGATYLQIHEEGGGIHFTVNHTRQSSEEELFSSLKKRILRMLRCGTTTVECKSGYGLDLETELKMLRVIERARNELPVDISVTYCGGHAVPRGSTPEQAVRDIVERQLPAIQVERETGRLHVDSIDVFCEKGVFSTEQSRAILKAGRDLGLRLNFHGDELHHTGSAEMGAELRSEAISHLEEISESGIQAMASAASVAVILPTTAFVLKLKSPPVRKMIQANVPVALGSDFNPNAYCLSMPTVMFMACVVCSLSLNEALVAATLNAAAALGLSRRVGSLEVGKQGDVLVVEAPRWEHIVYQLGEHEPLIRHVVKKGCVVFKSADDGSPSARELHVERLGSI